MPKCLECGFESSRLQWTHFKYNCTGRFASGTEYRTVYPDAKLVDDELSKRTAVTRDAMIVKYGEDDGIRRWDAYRQRQSVSNTFEYKQKKHGWSRAEYDAFNKSRASTLEGMIAKYGEESGIQKWTSYCEIQSYTNTKEYYISKYGQDQGNLKFAAMCRSKSHAPDVVMNRHGCSHAEAVIIIGSYKQSAKYTSDLEKQFVNDLESILNFKLDYTSNSKQYCVYGNNKVNFYDIVHNGRAIEFNGDFWHCNPMIYSAEYYHPIIQERADMIWERDAMKTHLLQEERHIHCLVAWEYDYVNNKEKILEECVEWILTGNK